ncbi:hypothetical protein [Vibrio harveyi]|uniref:Uncharacterized protein n=1 Tax=Vibrio harveyi TaxID=669 RepID=A0ABN4L955_VIBHA|nr:hypothetical protein [Vibrio harveyi]AMG01345.1 hypothetical protein AL538_27235 [Vibrio harveyi]ELY1986526.1 hypothetical protein [Vibrio harveyi]
MTNLEQAMAILEKPITIEALQELDALCARSLGEEADRIGDLWEAALVQASADVAEEYQLAALGLGEA